MRVFWQTEFLGNGVARHASKHRASSGRFVCVRVQKQMKETTHARPTHTNVSHTPSLTLLFFRHEQCRVKCLRVALLCRYKQLAPFKRSRAVVDVASRQFVRAARNVHDAVLT